ncbi:MAG: asparagine--tRNA ligase [Candidatus ainarchaeum sp.]|nr:asparagine--tRNA ligase [Candidatus ainarchaeum sp.]
MYIAKVLEEHKEGKEVEIKGWVHRIRKMKDKVFAVVRDTDDIIQVVFSNNASSFNDAEKLKMESALIVKGKLIKSEKAPNGYEIQATKLDVVDIGEDFPIQKDFSTEFLADNRHLWLRSRKMNAILKIRSTVTGAIHEYFRGQGFNEFQSPIFQSTQCEGGSELFEVKYFDKKMYLTQTWQLPAEAGIFSMEKIYTVSPTFRAEKSITSRHLTEFWMIEAEMAWMKFEDMLEVGEGLIKACVKAVLDKNRKELEVLGRDPKKLEPTVKKKFPQITYTEALKILKDKCKMDIEWGKDLRTVEEEKLMSLYDVPVIVTHYPKKVKAFYMKEDDKNKDVVLGSDFLAPEGIGEIVGGSERESNIDSIKKRLKEMGEDPKNYGFYLDTRKYGSVPHSGFGMGLERVVRWICGLENIKDAIAFPRTPNRFYP